MNSKLEDLKRQLRYTKAARDEKLYEVKKLSDKILALEIDIAALETEEKDVEYGSPD